MTTAGRVAGAAAVVSAAGLLVLVAAVGAVATFAEYRGTWSWYRQMEVVVSTAAEPAVALAALTAAAGLVAAARAS